MNLNSPTPLIDPRNAVVTKSMVADMIAATFYFTAEDGVLGQSEMGTKPASRFNLDQVTICTVVLKNGTRVVGANYGPASRELFDTEKGREKALEDAMRQVYQMANFQLREQLHQQRETLPY